MDDQPANLVALEAMLQGLGQNLVKADSGREALKWLLTHEFAVILLDVKMPEMDGFETAALIRQRDKSRHTPIIFLTAADKSQTQAVRGYAVGAVDYLVKPVVPEFVRSKVAVFVELAKKNALLAPAGPAAARERAGGAGAGRDPGRAGARPGAQEPGAGELQLRRLPRLAGAAPPHRSFSRAVLESQAERLDQTGRHFLDRVREASQADVAADRRRAVPLAGHPSRAAGAGSGPERARRR